MFQKEQEEKEALIKKNEQQNSIEENLGLKASRAAEE